MAHKTRQKGVATIEFALSFIALWLVTILLMDIGLQNYSTAVVNFAASESARDAKVLNLTTEAQFEDNFRKIIKRNHFSLWGILLNQGELRVKVKHYHTLKAFAYDLPSSQHHSERAPIAQYQVSYTYKPLLTFSLMPVNEIRRSVLVVQEAAKHG